jgi:hypothetical protein
VAQLGARLDGIEEVVGSNPIGSTSFDSSFQSFASFAPYVPFHKTQALDNNHIEICAEGRVGQSRRPKWLLNGVFAAGSNWFFQVRDSFESKTVRNSAPDRE